MKWIKESFLSLAILAAMFAAAPAHADDLTLPDGITIKQGMLVKWDDPDLGVKNLSTVTIAQTHALESFGDWNMLWDGWSVDVGMAWDANSFNTAALLLGRDVGTIGKYLPIDFPLKDKLKITVYPLGIFAEDVFDHPSVHGASGVAFIKLDVTW